MNKIKLISNIILICAAAIEAGLAKYEELYPFIIDVEQQSEPPINETTQELASV